jgi:hypothetical protein
VSAAPPSARPSRRRAPALLLVLVLAACSTGPTWYRDGISRESTHQVELDCHRRAILAIPAAENAAGAQPVHQEREQYFARCMGASGFERR